MTDVDAILRAHATAADPGPTDPDAWARLVARLEDEDGVADPPVIVPLAGGAARRPTRRAGAHRPGNESDGGRHPADRRRGRWALGAAAAVLALVAVAALVAVDRSGEDGAEEVRPADSAPAGPTTTIDAAGPGRPDIDEATLPDRMVGLLDHDDDGWVDLVRLDGIGRHEDRGGGRALLAPQVTVLLDGEAVAPARIGAVDVGPDGVAYVAVDDEVRAIGVEDGADRGPVAEGTDPAISGDGSRLATIVDGHVALRTTATGRTTMLAEDMTDEAEVSGVALSPDGSQLAIERTNRVADGTVLDTTVTVSSSDEPDGWVEVDRSSGARLPAFMPDGHLAVGLATTDATLDGTDVRADGLGMADLATGDVRWSVGGGGFAITQVDATPDGAWVLAQDGGVVRAFAAVDGWLWDSGTVVQLEGLLAAAW